MTRVLSELLGAKEPMFQRGVARLESVSGHNSADIRLSTEISRGVQRKLHHLGLDPKDTTGEELYHALAQRLKADDERLLKSLREKFGEEKTGTITQVATALRQVPVPRSVYALKAPVAKRVLKKVQPKHVMKRLGYRSFDSMLKHEQPATLLAVAWVIETAVWHKQILEQYKKLKSSDFEIRTMAILCPDTKRWDDFAAELVHEKRHTVLPVKELGTVVLLPLPVTQPPAATTVTLLLALHAMNDVRAASTFLKLCQVKPDFGRIVAELVADEPTLDTNILDRPVPWQIIQRYYARFNDRFRSEVFEPHVQPDDLAWHSIEKILTYIEPTMEFWHHTSTLSLLHNHQPVSMNIIDVALNYCNGLPYQNRIVRYFQHSLWHELLIGYLKHEQVEQSVLTGLHAELVDEPILI